MLDRWFFFPFKTLSLISKKSDVQVWPVTTLPKFFLIRLRKQFLWYTVKKKFFKLSKVLLIQNKFLRSKEIDLFTLKKKSESTKLSLIKRKCFLGELIEELKCSPQNVFRKTFFSKLHIFLPFLIIFKRNFDEAPIKLYTFGC